MAKIIDLIGGVQTNLYAAAAVPVGTELRLTSLSDDVVRLFSTAAAPTNADPYAPLFPSERLVNTQGDLGAWAICLKDGAVLVEAALSTGWRGAEGALPSAALRGERALNVQFYDESNRKLGSQWGASRRVVGAIAGQKTYTILKTRTLPVDLKARVFSYTGAGVIARFYTGFTPQTLPAPEPVYSLRPAHAAFRDFDLYIMAAAPASLGERWSYDLILEGPAAQQGKGVVNTPAGVGWVVDPNQEILMELESLDAQNIGGTLIMYNGVLDLPIA